jgi:hypothetical protein
MSYCTFVVYVCRGAHVLLYFRFVCLQEGSCPIVLSLCMFTGGLMSYCTFVVYAPPTNIHNESTIRHEPSCKHTKRKYNKT